MVKRVSNVSASKAVERPLTFRNVMQTGLACVQAGGIAFDGQARIQDQPRGG